MAQPSGTVTFLFGGIEASACLWQQGEQIGAFLAALLRWDVALSSEGMAGR